MQMLGLTKLDVVFFDPGLYASEGFTSGLLIFMRNTLKKFQERNLRVGIISFVEAASSKFWGKDDRGFRYRQDSGIDVYEYVAGSQEIQNPHLALEHVTKLLRKASPHTILMNTPAVFLDEKDVLVRELANETSVKVIHVLADQLFPTRESHDVTLVERLYSAIGKGEVIGVTERIRTEFARASGIACTPFKTVIRADDIAVSPEEYSPRYIGMVNTHPLKGIEIFDRVAAKMPQHDFLVVKNWPDVPDYIPSSANVTVSDFIAKPKDFYKSLKLLLIPSLMQEGPTMVSMEALYNGIPVIANRIGSIPEVGGSAIHFISPPKISGNRSVGTILYPVCTDADLDKVSDEYRGAIEETLGSFNNREFERLKSVARADILAGQQMMDRLVSRWVFDIV